MSSSAVISTAAMSPGGEIWALWSTLPPGKAVEEPADVPNLGKWAFLGAMLSGSSVESSGPGPVGLCRAFVDGRHDDQIPAAPEQTVHPGDMLACNYALGLGARHENRGSQPNGFAGLVVGGPWVSGMVDTPALYDAAGGSVQAFEISPVQFAAVEKEILDAGAMTLTIRKVVMQPGSRLVTMDRYPTVRMIEEGQLKWGVLPAGSSAKAQPEAIWDRYKYDFVTWESIRNDRQIALLNPADQPAVFIEWSVSPAQGSKP